MMEVQVELLFDEFAVRYSRGEQPDVREYLERAGSEREALGSMIDRYLQAVPARNSTEEDVVLIQAGLAHEPPLLALRLRRNRTREAVVEWLVAALGVDPGKTKKVGGYYHELETGLLDPAGVDATVWDALATFLKANVRALASLKAAKPNAPAPAYRRQAGLELHERMSTLPAPAAAEERDEVDRLFTARG